MSRLNFVWLLFLALLWGPSFLFIKVAVAEIPPLTTAALRVTFAALFLFSFIKIKGIKLPKVGKVWRHFAVLGFFANALPFFLFCWGEQYIDSAIASILNGTTPIFTLLIAHFFTADEKLSMPKLIGVIISFQGLIALVWPSLISGFDATAFGCFAVIVASLSYGIALVYARRNVHKMPKLVVPTAQLIMASIYLIPASFIMEQPFDLAFPSYQAIGSVMALAMLGTAIAFVVYYHILDRVGVIHLSMVTYIVPLFGVILGVAVLSESLTIYTYIGGFLIFLGVMTVNGTIRLPAFLKFKRV